MRKIAQKNEVSIMKLSARRGLECNEWGFFSNYLPAGLVYNIEILIY
jgi:hypothetical protein